MSAAYTDDDVQAAIIAIRQHREFSEKWADDTALCIAMDVLPAVAPAIAARALREFATDRVVHQTPARLIEDMFARADEIERTP